MKCHTCGVSLEPESTIFSALTWLQLDVQIEDGPSERLSFCGAACVWKGGVETGARLAVQKVTRG